MEPILSSYAGRELNTTIMIMIMTLLTNALLLIQMTKATILIQMIKGRLLEAHARSALCDS